jgi:hypothetical protein
VARQSHSNIFNAQRRFIHSSPSLFEGGEL